VVSAPDTSPSAAVAHAVVDADGVLLSADPAIAMLNAQAGGAIGRLLAVPPFATVARLAHRLRIVVTRQVTVADDGGDIQLRRAQPDGEQVRIAASGWAEIAPWRREARAAAPLPDGGWRWETDAALKLTFVSLDPGHGLDPFAMLGRPITALFGLDEGEDGSMPILDALARRRPLDAQAAMVKPTGAAVTIAATVRTDAEGGFAGLVGVARPVEARGRAMPLPASFTGGLDRALRRPLARIVANADSINAAADGPIAGDYADYAADIASAGRHLLGLVDDLVDLQAIERADFVPLAESIDLADLARRAGGLLAVRAEKAGVAIDRPSANISVPATGDFRRVLQILVNLVGNALRYSPENSRVDITVVAGAIPRVVVTDAGKGIAIEDQARIFEKFERIDPTEPGGNGLGLFIARRLARAMGGDLTVESAPGEGARFTLRLPAGQPPRD
jgi:signal transduction histidine kinase